MDDKSSYVRRFWEDRGRRIDDPVLAARFRADDRLGYDLELARGFCSPNSRVLDLGAGTCELSCHLSPDVREVVAVDFVRELLEKRTLPPNITPVVADIRHFRSDDPFDVVLVYGVLNYVLDDADIRGVYRNVRDMLAPDGICIIKHQSGVRETVTIDQYSEEFGTRYIAIYRQLEDEIRMLRDWFDVEVVDAYPAHLNRWDNTHFYAFVCRPKTVRRPGPASVDEPEREHRLIEVGG